MGQDWIRFAFPIEGVLTTQVNWIDHFSLTSDKKIFSLQYQYISKQRGNKNIDLVLFFYLTLNTWGENYKKCMAVSVNNSYFDLGSGRVHYYFDEDYPEKC